MRGKVKGGRETDIPFRINSATSAIAGFVSAGYVDHPFLLAAIGERWF